MGTTESTVFVKRSAILVLADCGSSGGGKQSTESFRFDDLPPARLGDTDLERDRLKFMVKDDDEYPKTRGREAKGSERKCIQFSNLSTVFFFGGASHARLSKGIGGLSFCMCLPEKRHPFLC